MKILSSLAKSMLLCMALIAILGIILSIIFFDFVNAIGIVYGILIGTSLSVFRFLSLESSVKKSLNMEQGKGKTHVQARYLLRFFVTIAVFTISSINHPTINLFGVAYGAINMQISIYICGHLESKRIRKNSIVPNDKDE